MHFTQDKIIVRRHGKTPGRPLDTKKAELTKRLNDVKGLVHSGSRHSTFDLGHSTYPRYSALLLSSAVLLVPRVCIWHPTKPSCSPNHITD